MLRLETIGSLWVGLLGLLATGGCGSSTTSTSANFLYSLNSGGSSVSGFSQKSDGTLTGVSTASVSTASNPLYMAASPTFLFTLGNAAGTINGFSIGKTGALTATSQKTLAFANTNASGLYLNPASTSLYVLDDPGSPSVYQYTVGSTGAVTALSPTNVSSANAIIQTTGAFDPSGDYFYVGTNNAMEWYTTASNGALTAAGSLAISAPTNTMASAVVVSPNGKFVYAAFPGQSPSDQSYMLQFTRNTTTGALTAMSPASVTSPSGPGWSGQMAVTPNNGFLYVPCQDASPNVIAVFSIGATGTLTAGTSVTAGQLLNGIAVDPAGAYLYVSDALANDILQFSIGSSGALTALSPPTVTTGASSNPNILFLVAVPQ